MKGKTMQKNRLAEKLTAVYSPLYATKDGGKSGGVPVLVADDRGDGDCGSDGRFDRPFAQLLVKPWSENTADICIRGIVPLDVGVNDWVKEHKANLVTVGGSALQFRVSRDSVGKLRELAEAVDGVVAPGREVHFPALNDVCPRTADSLRRLADNLDAAWGGSANAPLQQDSRGNGGGPRPPRTAHGTLDDGGSGQDPRGQRYDNSIGRP